MISALLSMVPSWIGTLAVGSRHDTLLTLGFSGTLAGKTGTWPVLGGQLPSTMVWFMMPLMLEHKGITFTQLW